MRPSLSLEEYAFLPLINLGCISRGDLSIGCCWDFEGLRAMQRHARHWSRHGVHAQVLLQKNRKKHNAEAVR